jgi:hypothetical protein
MKLILVIIPLFLIWNKFHEDTNFLTEQNLKLYCIDISMSMTGKKNINTYLILLSLAIRHEFSWKRRFYMRLIR